VQYPVVVMHLLLTLMIQLEISELPYEIQKTENVVPTIYIKAFSVYDSLLSLMFTIYKTRIIFYLWYIAKSMITLAC